MASFAHRTVLSRALRTSGVVAVALSVGMSALPARAQEPDEEMRKGIDAFGQGKFEEAEGHFRAVLKSKPDSERALRYREEAGFHFWVKVLASGGRLATVAKRILAAAEKGAARERQDVAKLKEEMQGLFSTDLRTEVETLERLVAKYGHYVVPEVVETLSDRHADDKRTRVVQLLGRLGEEGTLALIELLESSEVVLQQNAAVCLGHTRDVRAIPPLMRVAETTKDPHIKAACEGSIKQIRGGEASKWGAAEYFTRVSEAFYQENPLVMTNRYHEYVVWKWRDGKLTARTVPKWRWNEEVAEEFAYKGLALTPEDRALWIMLLNVYAQQWSEIEESLRVATQVKARGGEVDDESMQQMQAAQKELAKVKMLVASAGAERLLDGLGKALADQRAPVAQFLLERLLDVNLDPKHLEGGESFTYKTPAERDKDERPAKREPEPAKKEPEPAKKEPEPAKKEPEPKKVEDPKEPAPRKVDDDDGPPDLKEEGDKPRRRPRKVSSAPAALEGFASSCAPRTLERASASAASATALAGAERTRVTRVGLRLTTVAQSLSGASTASAKGSSPGGIETGGKALSAALVYGDKRVRYTAAIVLAHLNPPKKFANSDKVVENLKDALGETGQRVVLVVERDRTHRNRLVGLLRELGFLTFGVESGRDGLVRARSFPTQDLILVSSELNKEGDGGEPVEFQFIDDLRDDYRTKHVKVMILTPEDRVSVMKQIVDAGKALDVVPLNVDKATLATKLTAAFGSDQDKVDEKARKDALAERAALALASLRPGQTPFEYASAAGVLASNVEKKNGRPDSVRLACLKAIAAIGPEARAACLDALVREFKDDTNSIEVRRAIPVAIGECIRGAPIPGEVFETLKAALKSEDADLWRNAGMAIGKGQLTGAQAAAVFNEQRLE